MANPDHVLLAQGGSHSITEWRKKNRHQILDLSFAKLASLNLNGADLTNANLARADLRDTKLEQAFLVAADLREADLRGAKQQAAKLSHADLTSADLRSAFLTGVDFRGATLIAAVFGDSAMLHLELFDGPVNGITGGTLDGARFEGALFGGTVFTTVDLSTCRGLERAVHYGPSYVDLGTLGLCLRTVPKLFWEGCGVGSTALEYLPSLFDATKPIEFYSTFISYSHADETFAQRLHARLRREGLRVWYAPEDIKAGRKLFDQIDEAIHVHDKLLLVLSASSMTSEWVRTEVRRARAKEAREQRQVLFPIRLVPMDQIRSWTAFDADTGRDMAVEVREYHIPDFSHWLDGKEFEQEITKLLRDLVRSA